MRAPGWLGANNVELGTIDNGGTVTEIMFLADVYRRSSDTKYRDFARKGIDFLLTMQYPSGGSPAGLSARAGTRPLLELRHLQRRRDGARADFAGHGR